MKSYLHILHILLLSSLLLTNQSFLEDSIETHRLEWSSDKVKEYSKDKIHIEYSEDKGVYCKANEDLFKNQFTFDIPSDYIICGFDLFPFKIELNDIIQRIYNSKYGKEGEIRDSYKPRHAIHLFTLYLIYLDYKDKSEIETILTSNNLNEYKENASFSRKRQLEYLNTLPKSIFTKEMYDEDEYELFKIVGNHLEISNDISLVYNGLVNELKQNKLFGNAFLSMINSYDNYRYWYSILSSRAYRVHLSEYERLYNKSFPLTPYGKSQYKIYESFSDNFYSSCLVPFFDLCNHKSGSEKSETVEFLLSYRQGFVSSSINFTFKKGEEYAYSYIKNASNEKLLLSYGFYLPNNVFSATTYKFPLYKPYINDEKNRLIVKLNLLSYRLEGFLSNSNYNQIIVQNEIYNDRINDNILNILRIYHEPNDIFNEKMVEERVKHRLWLSYYNELFSLFAFKTILNHTKDSSLLDYYTILQSIEITKRYFLDLSLKGKDKIIDFKYRLRRNILQVMRESVGVQYKNNLYVMKKMRRLVSDNISKLKGYYSGN